MVRNNGLGSFNGPYTIATINLSTQEPIVPGDMDGDGDTDLVFGSSGSTLNLLWTANVNGTYNAQQITYDSTIVQVTALRTGDLDGDGDLDVVAGGTEALAWHANDGLGNLGPSIVLADSCTFCFLTRWLELGDMDTDGDLDLAFAVDQSSFVGWVENLGGGSFGTLIPLDTSESRPLEVVVADIDDDGDQDIVRSSNLQRDLSWLTNQGAGAFDPALLISNGVAVDRDLRATDLDGDQDLDLLAVWDEVDSAAVQWSSNVGGGLFSAPIIITDTLQAPRAAAPADLDLDGDLDVVVIGAGDALAYLNDGSGSFGPADIIPVSGSPFSLALGDVDGDLYDDLVLSYDTGGSAAIVLFPNNGGGSLGPEQSLDNSLAAATSLNLRDVDGDGDQDLLFLRGEVLHVMWNSAGALGPANQLSVQVDTISAYAMDDLDGDGLADLLTCGMDPDLAVRAHMNDGSGGFTGSWPISNALERSLSLITGDLDDDGDADVLGYRFGFGGYLSWFENPGLSTSLHGPVASPDLHAWPSPFTDHVRIRCDIPLSADHRIGVLDAQGRTLRSMRGNGTKELLIERGDLASGLYMLRVSLNGGVRCTARVMAE